MARGAAGDDPVGRADPVGHRCRIAQFESGSLGPSVTIVIKGPMFARA